MSNNSIKILLCLNGEKDSNKFVVDRNGLLLSRSLQSQQIEYTYDYKQNYDIVHVLSLNQLKTYYSLVKEEKRKPVVLTLFNDINDFKITEFEEDGIFKLNTNKLYKAIEGISYLIVSWPCQELIMRHFDYLGKIKTIYLGSKDYTKTSYLDIEKNAFRKFYQLPEDRKIIFTYGEYDYSKGIDILEAVSRMLPEYEFFFFGGKSGILSNSQHYERVNDIKNLHYEDHIHRELYHSLLMNASCLFLPYKFHSDTAMVLEAMKQGVPVVANKSPFMYDLLIKDKTALIGEKIEDFFKYIKDVSKKNYAKQAREFVLPYTVESYGKSLKQLYLKILNRVNE